MRRMNKEEILHLGKLSRIKISDDEATRLQTDIESVLAYVSVVNEITADSDITKKVGAVHNVFREDVVTCEGGVHTEKLLAEAPHRKGQHLQVKKILSND